MTRKIRWRRVHCPTCGNLITNNALGRSAHIRNCTKAKAAARYAPATVTTARRGESVTALIRRADREDEK